MPVFDPQAVIAAILALSPSVRYTALVHKNVNTTAVRTGLENASASESDRFEELLVNPAILLLTRNRGDLDCGGLDYLVVRYGNFFQLVMPSAEGHLSVCVASEGDPVALAPRCREVLARYGLA